MARLTKIELEDHKLRLEAKWNMLEKRVKMTRLKIWVFGFLAICSGGLALYLFGYIDHKTFDQVRTETIVCVFSGVGAVAAAFYTINQKTRYHREIEDALRVGLEIDGLDVYERAFAECRLGMLNE